MRFYGILILISILGLSGCTKGSRESRTISQQTPSVLPQELADQIGALGVYPHNDRFRLTREHGLEFYKPDNQCKICHGEDLGGGRVNVSCARCHEGFPHTEQFKKKTHGEAYLGNRKLCTTCHGSDYQGGNLKIACTGCHSYPHTLKWAMPVHHGKAYVETLNLKEEENACLKCHGESSEFKEKHPQHFVSCATCHTSIPHTEDFVYGGHDIEARTYAGKCTICHTDLKRLLPNLTAGCLECHDDNGEGKRPIVKWMVPDAEDD